MAFETGTASGHNDLVNKLVAFLSTNADLVADGQEWEVLRDTDLPFSSTSLSRIGFMTWNAGSSSYPATFPDNWPTDIASSFCKLKITGTLTAPSSGTYVLGLIADDQAEVYIDGVLVISKYTPSSYANSYSLTASTSLTAGAHTIEVRMIQLSSNGGVSLGWQKPGDGSVTNIPAGNYSGLTVSYGRADYADSSTQSLNAQMLTREVILKGPGLSASEEIYIALSTLSSAQQDLYNVTMHYATGYDPTKATVNQPGTLGALRGVVATMWDQSIKYWFVANGRRFIVIAKISTTYASMYGGFILPYALPSEMPYPIAVGANCAINARWSIQTADNSSFWNPAGAGSDSGPTGLVLRRTDGAEDWAKNISQSTLGSAWTYPYRYGASYRTSPDNSYALQPVVVYSSLGGGNVYGELQGVYSVSGFSNASENTQVIAGKTYLVVQSAYRTTTTDYAAILLE